MTEGTSRRARRARRKASGEDNEVRKPDEAEAPSEDAVAFESDAAEASEAEESSEASTQRIKDRNQRLRAEAAARRKAKRSSQRAESGAAGLDAGEMVDDAFARTTHVATMWLRRNFNLVQWMVVVGVVGGLGWQVYSWRSAKTQAKTSDALHGAVDKHTGWVGEKPSSETAELFGSVRASFEDDAQRLTAAEEAYNQASAADPGSTTAMLAKLGLTGLLYERGKYDKALEGYQALKGSKLYKRDQDVQGRILEGIALSLEGKGDSEAAMKAFRALENADLIGFEASGLYHQARLHLAAGKKDEARKALEKAKKRLEKWTSPEQPLVYLENSIRELEAAIDPSKATMMPSGAVPGGNLQDNPEELQRLIKELMAKKKGAPPTEMPERSPEDSAAKGPKDNPTPTPSKGPRDNPAPDPTP